MPKAMPSTAAECDHNHPDDTNPPSPDPAPILAELFPFLPPGPALDLACGHGANAIFLAQQRRAVTAVDWSAVGLELLEQSAHDRELAIRRASIDSAGPAR